MTPKTATVNRSQNATDSKRKKEVFDKTAKQLKEYAALILQGDKAKAKAVKLVQDFVASAPRGQKEKVRLELCKKAGIDRATFFRWQAEVEEDAQIPEAAKQQIEKDGRVLNSKLRTNYLEAYRENPEATFPEILQKAYAQVDRSMQSAAEVEPIQVFRDALEQYMRKTRDSADSVDDLLNTILDGGIEKEKLCAALKGVCK